MSDQPEKRKPDVFSKWTDEDDKSGEHKPTGKPVVKHDMLNTLLREEKIEEANALLAKGFEPDFSGTDFRALHLSGLNTDGLDFSNSYFRMTDLRGLDFRNCNLDGASLHSAKITGCYFPKPLSAEEIRMSVEHGTRLRYRWRT